MLILLAVFLIFGPDKIPGMARNLGKIINDVKRASEDVKTEINKEADRLDREKLLSEYKARVKDELVPEKTERREESSINKKEVIPEVYEAEKDPEKKTDTQ